MSLNNKFLKDIFYYFLFSLTTVISKKPSVFTHSQKPSGLLETRFPEDKHPQRGGADKISDKFCQAKYDWEYMLRIGVST